MEYTYCEKICVTTKDTYMGSKIYETTRTRFAFSEMFKRQKLFIRNFEDAPGLLKMIACAFELLLIEDWKTYSKIINIFSATGIYTYVYLFVSDFTKSGFIRASPEFLAEGFLHYKEYAFPCTIKALESFNGICNCVRHMTQQSTVKENAFFAISDQ